MSELLDELARSLAKEMPRGRALRTLGGLLIAAAVPGVARPPGTAQAATRRASGPCTDQELRLNADSCRDLTRETGRTYVPCIASGGPNCNAACCPPGNYCCLFPSGGVTCCHPDFGGVCDQSPTARDPCRGSCRPGEKRCGRACCRRGEECRRGRCCKKCGDRACCSVTRRAAAIAAASAARRAAPRRGGRCAARRARSAPSRSCPATSVSGRARRRSAARSSGSTRTRSCAARAARSRSGGPGIRVGPGLSPFCCPRSRACGSGASLRCCQRGLTGSETCCGGRCVDLQFDAMNCGRCGNVCPSGVCRQGACS